MKKSLPVLLALSVVLAGCGASSDTKTEEQLRKDLSKPPNLSKLASPGGGVDKVKGSFANKNGGKAPDLQPADGATAPGAAPGGTPPATPPAGN
jgi:hypothetical protein